MGRGGGRDYQGSETFGGDGHVYYLLVVLDSLVYARQSYSLNICSLLSIVLLNSVFKK